MERCGGVASLPYIKRTRADAAGTVWKKKNESLAQPERRYLTPQGVPHAGGTGSGRGRTRGVPFGVARKKKVSLPNKPPRKQMPFVFFLFLFFAHAMAFLCVARKETNSSCQRRIAYDNKQPFSFSFSFSTPIGRSAELGHRGDRRAWARGVLDEGAARTGVG